MHRIDSSTATGTFPTPDAVGTPGYFAHGNPGAAIPYTQTTADWGNAIQEEISAVIEGAGITLDKTQHNQLFTALQSLTLTKLTSNLNLYVSTTGSDSNNGLSSGTPFLTLQHVWNYVYQSLHLNGHTVTINVADGTYTAGVACAGLPAGSGSVIFLGNTGTPSNCFVNVTNGYGFAANAGAIIQVKGFKVAASGSGGDFAASGTGLSASTGGVIYFGPMEFGACGVVQITSFSGGLISTLSAGITYTISGNAQWHISSGNGGSVVTVDGTVILTSTPAFTTFCLTAVGGYIDIYNQTFSGSATGARYFSESNGVINTAGAGASYLPGNTSGALFNGGQYI